MSEGRSYFTDQIEKEDERRRVRCAYYDLLLERGSDTRDDEIVRLKEQVRYWKHKATTILSPS